MHAVAYADIRLLAKLAKALGHAAEAQEWTAAAEALLPRLQIFFVERRGSADVI